MEKKRFQQFPSLTVLLERRKRRSKLLQHSARVQDLLEGSSAACPPNPVSVSSRSGCSTAACVGSGESPKEPLSLLLPTDSSGHCSPPALWDTFHHNLPARKPGAAATTPRTSPSLHKPHTLVGITDSASRICTVDNFPRFPWGNVLPT